MSEIQVGSIDTLGNSIYQWKIPNFSKYDPDKIIGTVCMLVSPVFSSPISSVEFKWMLKISSTTAFYSNRKFLVLHAECLSNYLCISATVFVGILKNNNAILVEKTEHYQQKDIILSFFNIAEWEFLLNPANRILKDDILTIYCRIKTKTTPAVREPNFGFLDIPALKSQSNEKNELSRQATLRLEEFDDFENLLENDHDFSDVSISIEDKTVMLHKCILAKRSPVFRAMFQSDMKERRNNAVQVKDIKYDVFIELMRFIYSGNVRQLEVIAMDLLVVADKYQIENLKNLCEIELMKQLSVENAVSILKLADKHHAKKLEKQTIEYIVVNRISVFDQAEFRTLSTELMFQICQALK